jgi:hypothetical protein
LIGLSLPNEQFHLSKGGEAGKAIAAAKVDRS